MATSALYDQLNVGTATRVLVADALSLRAVAAHAARRGLDVPFAYRWGLRVAAGWSRGQVLEVLEDGQWAGAGLLARRAVTPLYRHDVVTAPAFGALIQESAWPAAVQALRDVVRRDPRVLRLSAGIFDLDGERRARLGGLLAEAGFRRRERADSYEWTILVPLAPDEAMLAAFGTSTRRNLRLIEKAPVRIAPIDSPIYAERIDYLAAAAVQRSGGLHVPRDWATLIELTAQHPSLARLVGVFREDREGPDSLVAFAWGWMHGQRAEYRDGGSMREPDLKAPLAHGLVWDLMRWARAQGASSFDMGGVTPGKHADGSDALGGISEFKRGFGSTVVNVHEEWVLDATTLRAALARFTRRFLHRHGRSVTGTPFAGAGPSPTSS